jgi:adenine-specific DNA-methyltransferase
LNDRMALQQFDAATTRWLPLPSPLATEVTNWAILHGWDVQDLECQRLLVRQALLNSVVRQLNACPAAATFATPLDTLGIVPPRSLTEAVEEYVGRAACDTFNPWGRLYSTLVPQSQRRRIGQFWTDELIADWMITWLLASGPGSLVDVGCGAGNFLLKATERSASPDVRMDLFGLDISPLLLNLTLAALHTAHGEAAATAVRLEERDYLYTPLPTHMGAVICNPPYTRHHHIPAETKAQLQAFFKRTLRLEVSRQGTLAFYFLLKLIAEMPQGASAAVIAPMETLDARYGSVAKRALCEHTEMAAIIHFSAEMNAFHKVDVGASILLFRKGRHPGNQVRHLTLTALPTTADLMACLEIDRDISDVGFGSLVIEPQDRLLEVPKWRSITMFTRQKVEPSGGHLVVPLKALASVVRGIATGANEFFVLSTTQVGERALESYVVRTLQRNREIQDIVLDERHWQSLSDAGKRVWLLYLRGDGVREVPAVQRYLAEGESRGFHLRSLVQTRREWYAMEQREVPPIFFTILTRGNPRFILNLADVRPLNMFSLIYPNRHIVTADAVELLWALLNSSYSISRLHSVSRTYGGNTLKVEPRELGNLPVPNPLALPDDLRCCLTESVAAFMRQRDTTALIQATDAVVEALLTRAEVEIPSVAMPLQLQLLEQNAGYAPTSARIRQRAIP